MTDPQSNLLDDAELTPPQRLKDGLRALYPAPPVPAAANSALLAAAQRHFARRRRLRLVLRLAPAAAAAAAVIVAALLWHGHRPPVAPATSDMPVAAAPAEAPRTGDAQQLPPPRLAAVLPQDLDGSGRVDILDAFKLARCVAAGEPTPDSWDFNKDGVVDRRDADTVAQSAVRVARGT